RRARPGEPRRAVREGSSQGRFRHQSQRADEGARRFARVEPRAGKATNGQDIINYRNGLIDQVLFLADAVDASGVAPTRSMEQRVGEIDAAWQALDARVRSVVDRDVGELNSVLAGTAATDRPTPTPVPQAGLRPV